MNPINTRVCGGFIGAAILLSLAAPASAQTYVLSRCNQTAEPYGPVMQIDGPEGRARVEVGENGLDGSAVYSASAAIAWARASGLFPTGASISYDAAAICGNPAPENEPQVEEADEVIDPFQNCTLCP